MKKAQHPIQPMELDSKNVIRFKRNEIVDFLYVFAKDRGYGMNDIVMDCALKRRFNQEDLEQFYQLIGYSYSGFGDLGQVSDKTFDRVDKRYKKLLKKIKG